jgi:hypothetical protein
MGESGYKLGIPFAGNICPACGGSGTRPRGGNVFCAMCGMRLSYGPTGHPEISVHGSNADEVERVSKALMATLPESRIENEHPPKDDMHVAAFELESAADLIETHIKTSDESLLHSGNWSSRVNELAACLEKGKSTFFQYVRFYPHAIDQWPHKLILFRDQTPKEQFQVLNEVCGLLKKYATYLRSKLNQPSEWTNTQTTIHHHYGSEHQGDTHMGDVYKDFTAAAVGPHSTAHHTTISVWKQAEQDLDLNALTTSLAALRPKLRAEDPNDEHEDERLQISAAEKAAKQGDKKKVLEHLKEAGKWVFEVATKIGEEVAAKAITTAMGLPG